MPEEASLGRRKGTALTAAEVIETAVRIAQEEGADAVGVSNVARALGIRPASMYNHVASGEALMRAVAEAGNARLLEALKGAVRRVVDPKDQVRRLAHGARDWALANGGLYSVMARVEPDYANNDIPPSARDLLDLFERPLGQLGVPEAERVHGIRSLRASIHGFVLLETTGQFQLAEDVDESFRWSVERMVRGVAST